MTEGKAAHPTIGAQMYPEAEREVQEKGDLERALKEVRQELSATQRYEAKAREQEAAIRRDLMEANLRTADLRQQVESLLVTNERQMDTVSRLTKIVERLVGDV